MNFWDIIIICAIIALVAGAVRLYRKGRSSGCCGCADKDSGCAGKDSGCAGKDYGCAGNDSGCAGKDSGCTGKDDGCNECCRSGSGCSRCPKQK